MTKEKKEKSPIMTSRHNAAAEAKKRVAEDKETKDKLAAH